MSKIILYNCEKCKFITNIKCNYGRHLLTNKHKNDIIQIIENVENCVKNVEKNEKNVEKNEKKIRTIKEKSLTKDKNYIEIEEKVKDKNSTFLNEKNENFSLIICNLCCKKFSRKDSLIRHLSSCKINKNFYEPSKTTQNVEKNLKNEKKILKGKEEFSLKKNEKKIFLIENKVNSNMDDNKSNLRCSFCSKSFELRKNTLKHENNCFKREKELLELKYKYEVKLKEIDIKTKEELLKKDIELERALNKEKDKTIELMKDKNLIINNNETNNKTINYLNYNFGNMINMERFLFNLEHKEQLTTEERKQLLLAFENCGMDVFARNFSYIMKENCKRQLIKEGLEGYNMIPLYCSDSNLRSHKEKKDEGWKSCYNNQSINSMLNISSDQVYKTYSKPLLIVGKSREKIYKQVKQDNCENNKKLTY
jgi:hypothetical protein